jgi:uncharacterized protein (TIGR04255 family)
MQYESNYITYAICKFTFPRILDFNEYHPPVEFQKRIVTDFPLVTVDESDDSEDKEWIFTDKENTKLVAISNEYIHIEFTKYTNFDNFYEYIRKLIDICKELYSVADITQVSLRYINEIEFGKGNPFAWQNYINKNLLFNYNDFVEESHKLLKIMQTFEFIKNDNQIVFNFGLPNSEYPEPISRKEFVLDYEATHDYILEVNDLYDKIKELNDIIGTIFENSIEDGLRDEMGRR